MHIHGLGNISPQNTYSDDFFEGGSYIDHNERFMWCVEPPYKDYIPAGLVRRMGRIIRMSVAAAELALHRAGIECVDAILTGTAMGCLQDTEKFLSAMIENGEQMLTPTAFVQSTHNTIGGQIALIRQNTCYNLTYVHRGFSFESALLDALLRIREGESQWALLGGVDELTKHNELFFQELGCVKSEVLSSSQWLQRQRLSARGESPAWTDGAYFGEGASFFVLSPQASAQNYGKIAGLRMCYKPTGRQALRLQAEDFLKELGWAVSQVDAVVLGNSGDRRFDWYYNDLQQQLFAQTPQLLFKHLCGEYSTSSAFALWLAAQILHRQNVPSFLQANPWINLPKNIEKILIYNHHQGANHSFIAIENAQG